jgi:integrase
MRVKLKGIAKVKAKGRTYYYAWRSGPRLRGEPGTPEFMSSYNEAVASVRAPDSGRFISVIVSYKGSSEFKKLARSTKEEWSRWLDRIADHFGSLSIAQFDRAQKIRPVIRRWRDQWTSKPRTADYSIQVLSRLLSHAVEQGLISCNACEGIKGLYSSNRSETIWTDADLQQLREGTPEKPCPREIWNAVQLAVHTGLRLGDLLRLSWSHIGEDAIVLRTSKSRGRREAIIPLYDALREVLARIPKSATTVLTSSKGRPWTVDGFGSSFNTVKHSVGLSHKDLHFHDLRGTAATRFYVAGLSPRVIAEILGWSEVQVERIIGRYVGRAAATKEAIRRLNEMRR